MLRNLHGAFWASWEVPGLGRLPLNVLALSGLGILGFGNSGFWFMGAGLEVFYLYMMAMNPRFQAVIDSEAYRQINQEANNERAKLLSSLDNTSRARLETLEERCRKVLDLLSENPYQEITLEVNRGALQKLFLIYMKLLVAQRHLLQTPGYAAVGKDLEKQIASLRRELENVSLSPTLRESKTATMRITEQRLHNLHTRDQRLSELQSDMERIEAQVELAMENARLRNQGEVVPGNITLASQLLDESLYGDDLGTVAAFERSMDTSGASPFGLGQGGSAGQSASGAASTSSGARYSDRDQPPPPTMPTPPPVQPAPPPGQSA
ncbi:hypothetical protein DB346_09140 [Verrucomicrobia bacterium LW23]|nr:hypothetical protein DB346_09140 [Verrucomicrobia bacterium LW23]